MDRLTVGLGPNLEAIEGRELRRRFAKLLARALRIDVAIVVAETYPRLIRLIGSKHVQMAWAPPAIYIRVQEALGVVPVVALERSTPGSYRGCLFARADDTRSFPEGFRGAKVAWVDGNSSGGFLFPRFAMVEKGLHPDRFFSDQLVCGTHSGVVLAVAQGRADMGATYMHVEDDCEDPLAFTSAGFRDFDSDIPMRPLLRSRTIPSDLICAQRDVPAGFVEQAAELLGSVHETERGATVLQELFQARRFVPADLRDYEVVRAALNVADLPALDRKRRRS